MQGSLQGFQRALYHSLTMSDKSDPTPDLSSWFSPARMSSYWGHSDPQRLYIWNARVSKNYLEDIQHVEVLLRNRIHDALVPRYGDRWFDHSHIPFDVPAKRAIGKAKRRAGDSSQRSANPGKVIAELSLDFWRFLLTNTYTTTVWPNLQKTLVGRPKRRDFEHEVIIFYDFRNRAAHHEPVIRPSENDEARYLDRVSQAIYQTATWISPEAAEWIQGNSRVPEIRSERPD